LEAAQILTGFGSFFGGVFGLGVAGGLVRSMAFFVLRLTITCTMFSSLLSISALIGPTFWVQQNRLAVEHRHQARCIAGWLGFWSCPALVTYGR